jgi:hypothetical protein
MIYRPLVYRALLILWLLAVPVLAQSPVYLVLWFDTEDYMEPSSDDAALRIATDLEAQGVRATFKVVGEKARVLEARGRTDVIRALSKHCIGYHSNFHSIPPAPSVYLRRMGFLEGAAEFERREAPGAADIKRIFGVTPVAYGQPGSSWGPQSNPALRHMGIPVYLDEGTQVGVDSQPFWFGGLLHIFNMGDYSVRLDVNHEEKNAAIFEQFDADVKKLSASGGGVISTYFHPTEFVTTEFWDAVNFSNGAARDRKDWVRPHMRTKEESERCYALLKRYVEHALKTPGVHFVTAQDMLQLYLPQAAPTVDRAAIARHLASGITFLKTGSAVLSPADMLLQLLGLEPQIVDGPSAHGSTTYHGESIPAYQWESAKKDVASYISSNHRLPPEAFLGSETLSLADFTATLANAEISPGEIHLQHGQLAFERYFATDPEEPFRWPIHPPHFAAPELLDLARLQGWTLKPALLR